MKARNRWLLVSTFSLILSFLLFTSVAKQATNQSRLQTTTAEQLTLTRATDKAAQSQLVTVDGVTMRVSGPLIPESSVFISSAPGDAIQAATAVTRHPFFEISIIAVPFGTKTAAEDLPVATSGGAVTFRSALRQHRLSQGNILEQEPVATVFGQRVTGMTSLLNLRVEGSIPTPVLINEWVVEAGERLWIVRVSRQQSSAGSSDLPSAELAEGPALTIDSTSIYQPSTVASSSKKETFAPDFAPQPLVTVAASDLPAASWWNGNDCDSAH